MNSLLQPAFDAIPFGRGDDPGDQVKREDTFRARGITVDVERNTELE